jgi:glycosyltransferase involved in cell wall biosynthesis
MSVGGIQTYVLNVLQQYDRLRWQMDVCYTGADPGCNAVRVIQLGSRLLACRYGNSLAPFIWRLTRLLRAGGYDGVCDFTGDFAAAAMCAARLARVPTRIAFYRSSGIQFRPTWARRCVARLLHRSVLWHATTVLSNSRSNLASAFTAGELRRHRCLVVYNGINVRRFRPTDARWRTKARQEFGLPTSAFVIGHVGSFTPPKAQEVLIDAFAQLRRARPGLHLLLVGEGPLRPQAKRRAVERGVDGSVTFAGIRHDVWRVLRAIDLFVMPSRFEGFPNALIEAQAMGLPVIATNRPEMREALAPESHDATFPVDDAAALAAQIRAAVDFPHTAAARGAAGRAFVMKYLTIDRSVRAFCAQLEDRPAGRRRIRRAVRVAPAGAWSRVQGELR